MKLKINKWTLPFWIFLFLSLLLGFGVWFLPKTPPFNNTIYIIKMYFSFMSVLLAIISVNAIRFWSK